MREFNQMGMMNGQVAESDVLPWIRTGMLQLAGIVVSSRICLKP